MSSTTLLAKAIDVRLTRMGKNRAWLANELGSNAASLSNRLNGRTRIDTDWLDAVAKALGLRDFFELAELAEAEAQQGVAA